jgi:hypothetical protein
VEEQLLEKLRIREVIENWALWRDSGDWDRFRTVWAPEGEMMATWMQGPAEDFILASIDGWNKGVSILHFLGGSSIDVTAHRAIAQTKMTITQRADVEGVTCDIICTGRFYDFMEKQNGEWKVVLRQPIYEADRILTIAPGKSPELDPELLAEFPTGYRHLAYAQSRIGYPVKKDMPGLTGAAVENLYERGSSWLNGQ